MATLTINGQKVKVGDEFLRLSPADQEKTVEEIASKLGHASQNADASPAQPAPQSQPSGPQDAFNNPIADQLSAGFTSGINAIPIAGPTILGGLEHLKGMVQGRTYDQVHASDAQQAEARPEARTIGTVAGNVLPFLAGGEIPVIGKALGFGAGPLLGRTLAAGGSNALISGADALSRGATPQEAGTSAALGGTLGLAMPGAGDLLGRAIGALANKAGQAWNTLTRPEVAAQKMVSGSAVSDLRAGNAMTPADEASAALNGQPLVNADRFGTSVRGLARTAANSNPVARQALTDLTQDRFLTQSGRASDFIKRVAPGVDDLKALDQLQSAARTANKTAYDAAYSHPSAQVVWTPQIKALFQSPDFIKAIRGAERTGANDAATSGVKSVKSPFVFDAQGNIGLRKQPNGSTALPSLQFWDIVQRNLRQASEEAYRSGRNLDGSQLAEMRRQLTGALDQAVPQFAKARAGAAAAFGAEDALEAGKKFVGQRMAIPEAERAIGQMTAPEKKLFATGFASELLDKIGAARDGVNVIDQAFGSPAARKQVELALGKPAADQLEQFVRVENILQTTKQHVQGNSSTVQQLAAMGGIGALGGGFVGGWDPRNMATGAGLMMAGRMGMRAMGKAVDQRVMKRVAEILVSNDPKEINRQILNATLSPQHANAIKAIQAGLQAVTRGASVSGPVQITVHGGAQ